MKFDLSDDQRMMRESYERFLNEHSSTERVRAAAAGNGFDAELWKGLAELGALALRVPEQHGGLGLGLMDAVVLMEEAGRTLASGPLAESLAASRVLALLGGSAQQSLLSGVLAGEAVVSLAFIDIAETPVQWVAGGAVAAAIICREGGRVTLATPPADAHRGEANLASTALAEIDFRQTDKQPLSEDATGLQVFQQALEEWKLLTAAALSGLSREAVRQAAEYACEREAFDQPIGSYQGISHPLADLIVDIDGGRYFLWKTIHDIHRGLADAAAEISLASWWNTDTAARAVAQALHTFGGYGLSTEYDIHLFNLRAKAWPLVLGDPARLLEEAGRRLYAGETTTLPDAGEVSIDFDLGDAARTMAEELDDFFNRHLTPELLAQAHYSFDGFNADIHRKLADARLLFPAWPEAYGGRAAPPYVMYALRRVWEAHEWSSHAVDTTDIVGTMIRHFGTEELKDEVLTKIAAGEAICCLGYSEPGSGSDVFAVKTRAVRDGDGWRIDGAKMFTSGANIAQYVLLLTRTDPELPKHKGLTMFVVPLDAEGIEIQPIQTFQDERTNATYYDGVRVHDRYRLGPVNEGVKVMASALEQEQAGSYAMVQGAMIESCEQLCRSIQYRGRPLLEDIDTQKRLARATAHRYLAEVITNRALWASVQKLPNRAYGPMAKLFSSEKFLSDARDLLDLTAPHSLCKRKGPAGFLNQCYRHAQATTIYGGTSEVLRSLIAERNLGLPRSRA